MILDKKLRDIRDGKQKTLVPYLVKKKSCNYSYFTAGGFVNEK